MKDNEQLYNKEIKRTQVLTASDIGGILRKHQSKIKEVQPSTQENRQRSSTIATENLCHISAKNRSSSFSK